MKHSILLFLAGCMIASSACRTPVGGHTDVEASDAATMLARPHAERPLLLDVRTAEEFAVGYIDGALLVPVGELEARVSELAKFKESEILVYCHAGARSSRAARFLTSQGFKTVYNLNGGLTAWRSAGRPVAGQKTGS